MYSHWVSIQPWGLELESATIPAVPLTSSYRKQTMDDETIGNSKILSQMPFWSKFFTWSEQILVDHVLKRFFSRSKDNTEYTSEWNAVLVGGWHTKGLPALASPAAHEAWSLEERVGIKWNDVLVCANLGNLKSCAAAGEKSYHAYVYTVGKRFFQHSSWFPIWRGLIGCTLLFRYPPKQFDVLTISHVLYEQLCGKLKFTWPQEPHLKLAQYMMTKTCFLVLKI